MPSLTIPHEATIRTYQKKLWECLYQKKRGFFFIHRRAGKDFVCVNILLREAINRVGVYYYLFPTYEQARKVIWEGITNDGRKFIDMFPSELVKSKNEVQMSITLINGSVVRLIGTDRYDCYDDQTEILTDEGWKYFKDIRDDEVVATLTKDGVFEYAEISERLEYNYTGDMYEVSNNAIDLMVTPNHKFWVQSRKGVMKFKEISDDTILNDKIPSTCLWLGEFNQEFEFPLVDRKYISGKGGTNIHAPRYKLPMDLFCKFMGIWLAEGSKRICEKKGTYEVAISQRKPHIRKQIEELLNLMGVNWSYRAGSYIFSNKQICLYLRQFGVCDQKFVPQVIKNLCTPYLKTFLEWFIMGDGHVTKKGVRLLFSTSKQMIDDFQEIIIKAGYSGNVSIKPNALGGTIRGRQIIGRRTLYQLSIRRSKYKYFQSSRKNYRKLVPYSGKVYCVDVKNHVVKVRRNGKEAWCGNSIRGTNPVGCVFSEFAFQNPMAWDIIRPILRANDGWAIFISTPNAENHAWELYTRVKDNENWVTQLLTIDDTYALTKEDLEEERLSGMSEAMIRQEYYCDPFALQDGVVYGKEIKMLGDRVGDVAYDPLLPVQTFWDLGRSDQAVIWFVQLRGDRINLIDYHENTGEWVGDWITLLKEKKYSYMPLGLPHDAFAKRNEAKHSIAGQFEEAGFPVKKVQLTSIQNGISAVRRIFPRLHFDKTRCNQGLTMLKSYSYEYDQTLKKFKNSPKHDVYSHACLTGDTRILTTRGDVSIKNIKEGEKVALDGIEATVVCAKQTGRKEVYTLEFESGHKIESTQDHKFFTTRGLVRAGDLRYNDTVHTLTKPLWRLLDFKSIGIKEGIISNTKELNTEYGHEGDRLLKITYKGFEEVYDLTVEKHHAYYANGILVSNSDALRYLAVGIEELAKEENYDKMAQEYINPKPKFDELGVKADEYRDYEKSLKQFLYD